MRGDIYDEWLTESGTRSYGPAPVFLMKDFPGIRKDRQPDGARGRKIYDAKGHQGSGPSGEEIRQYEDYLTILSSGKTKYTAIVYVMVNYESRKKWKAAFDQAQFAP